MSSNNRKKSGGQGDDEVEELLRAAEDEMLLNLSLNSHMSRGSAVNSYIDPDLDRRFLALKSSKSSSAKTPITTKAAQAPPAVRADKVENNYVSEDDDLFARFAALKGSLPFPSSSSGNCKDGDDFSSLPLDRRHTSDGCRDQGNVDEDEVQKVIRWAMDAARLDPSSPNDDDDSDKNDDDDSNEDDDSDEEDDDDFADRMKREKKRPPK